MFLRHESLLIKQDRDFLYNSFTDYKKQTNIFLSSLLQIQKLLSITPPNSPRQEEKNSETDIDNVESYIQMEEIYKKIEELMEKQEIIEKENYALKTERNNEKYHFENEKITINEQLSFLQDNLNKMNKRLEECNDVIQTLERQNLELKESSRKTKDDSIEINNMGVLLKSKENLIEKMENTLNMNKTKIKKKKEKINNFKKQLVDKEIEMKTLLQKVKDFESLKAQNTDYFSKDSKLQKSLRNSSISFEENLKKDLLNHSISLEELNLSELLALKDPSEMSRRFEALKQKSEQNKQKYQKRLKEFELILRYLEKQLDFLIDNNSLIEEKDSILKELLEKNENLNDWMNKLTNSFNILATKNQRSLASEREFILKIGYFLLDLQENASSELSNGLSQLKETQPSALKFINLHNMKQFILEIMDSYMKRQYKTPKKAVYKGFIDELVEKLDEIERFFDKLRNIANIKGKRNFKGIDVIIRNINLWREDIKGIIYSLKEGKEGSNGSLNVWRKELDGILKTVEKCFEIEEDNKNDGLLFLKEVYSDLKGIFEFFINIPYFQYFLCRYHQ